MTIEAQLRKGKMRLATKLPAVSWEFLFRAGLVAVFATVAHVFRWEQLRFRTSHAILHLSALLGMQTTRVTFDTIRVRGELFQFVVACTFVDVYMGSIPLLWSLKRSFSKNLAVANRSSRYFVWHEHRPIGSSAGPLRKGNALGVGR